MTWTKKQGRLFVILALITMALLSTLPFLRKDYLFADDWLFHFNRILGVAEGLKSGQFPVRIYPQVYFGAGYQAPLYYPDLFLYLPGILVRLGMPLIGAVGFFHFVINFFTSFFAWLSMRKMKASSAASVMVAAAWCFCPYRLSDLYSRYALGETLALCFLPLVIAGFYEIFLAEKPRFFTLAFGMSGVILSHVLSTLFALGFLIVFSILFFDRLVKKPKILIFIGGAALLSFLLTAFFLIPFFQADRTNTMVSGLAKAIWEEALQFRDLLLPVSPDHNHVYFVGFSCYLFLGAAVFCLLRKKGFFPEKRLILCLLCVGIFTLFMCTTAFPWEALCRVNDRLCSLISMIQFPSRLIGPGCLLVLSAGGLAFSSMDRKEETEGDPEEGKRPVRWKIILATVVTASCLGSFLPYCYMYPENRAVVLSEGEIPPTDITWEYLYYYTDPYQMMGAAPIASDGVELFDYQKNGTNIALSVSAPTESFVDTTLFNFTGYEAADADGKTLETAFGENNRLRILFHEPYEGKVFLRYTGLFSWKIWTVISFLTLAFCVAFLIYHSGALVLRKQIL